MTTRSLLVNNFGGAGIGGGEVLSLQILEALLSLGEVECACARASAFAAMADKAGASVAEYDMSPTALPSTIRAMRGRAAEQGVGLAVGTGYLTNIMVRRAAPSGCKVVNVVPVEPDAAIRDGSSRLGLLGRRTVDVTTRSRVDAFVAVAHVVSSQLVDRGVDADKIMIIPNAVDTAGVRAEAERSARPTALPEDVTIVGALARLEKVKGVEFFIRAAAAVTGETPVAFAVAGTGSEESRLRELAVAHGLQDRLTFLGRVDDSAAFLAACDIVVMPSLSEGMPLVPMEAMALGKPVVATAVGGAPEVVVDGETGLLVPPGDGVALAGAIDALLRDADARTRMGSAGRARADQHFSTETLVARYADLFARVVS
jgi:glycosyltransferase involved in cell wall biosynthesis